MLKEKLLSKYFISEEISEESKLTPLRKFVDSIGLDWTKMNRKQMTRWSNTKRYKDYFALMKIKKLADASNIKESFVFDNYQFFISNFALDIQKETEITKEEAISFIQIMEAISPPKVKFYKGGKRGHYKSLEQRKQTLKNRVLSTVNTGGVVSSGEGQILFAGTGKRGKHAKKTLGANRILLKTKVRTPTGMRYHRKVYQTPTK